MTLTEMVNKELGAQVSKVSVLIGRS